MNPKFATLHHWAAPASGDPRDVRVCTRCDAVWMPADPDRGYTPDGKSGYRLCCPAVWASAGYAAIYRPFPCPGRRP